MKKVIGENEGENQFLLLIHKKWRKKHSLISPNNIIFQDFPKILFFFFFKGKGKPFQNQN